MSKHNVSQREGRTKLGRACHTSGKMTYTTRNAAKKHAKHLRSKRGSGGIYRCKHCDYWHLTSRPTMAELAKRRSAVVERDGLPLEVYEEA